LQTDTGCGVGVGDIGDNHTFCQALTYGFEAQFEGDGKAVV
jgi:hypothetical protein